MSKYIILNDDHTWAEVEATQPFDPRPIHRVELGMDPNSVIGDDCRDCRIVFAAGTHFISQTINAGVSNVLFQADGITELRWTGPLPWASIFGCNSNTRKVTVRDLAFTSIGGTERGQRAGGIYCAGEDVTIEACIGIGLDTFVNCEANPKRWKVNDSRARDLVAYGVWLGGSDGEITNFKMNNSTREHCIRGPFHKLRIQGCDLANTTDPLNPADFTKSCIRLMDGEDCQIDDTTIRQGPIQVGTNQLEGETGIAKNVRINNLTMLDGANLHYGRTDTPPGGAVDVFVDGVKQVPTKW